MLIVYKNRYYIVYQDGMELEKRETEIRSEFRIPEDLVLVCFGQYENAWMFV